MSGLAALSGAWALCDEARCWAGPGYAMGRNQKPGACAAGIGGQSDKVQIKLGGAEWSCLIAGGRQPSLLPPRLARP